MANPDRDTANLVYTPKTTTRTVSAAESVPSTDSDGTDCTGFNVLAVTRTLITASTCDYTLYLYNGNEWVPAEVSTGLATDEYDPTATSFYQQYSIAGALRFAFVITSITGGDATVTENISV